MPTKTTNSAQSFERLAVTPVDIDQSLTAQRRAELEQDATTQRRGEIIAYIKGQLGPDLAHIFADAIASSVDTGCYDYSWQTDDVRKIEQYITGLKQYWLGQQGDQAHILNAALRVLGFGSDDEKKQLKKLLHLE